ncbi:MAG: 16S rRNA (guanine(527)-N(7))-methyltransferase RsmG [Solirubrobacterales bacterium]
MKVDDPIVPGASHLRGLCDRYGLSEGQHDQLGAILRALASDDRAPTAVRDPARAVEVHLADSLVALELEVWGSARRIADLGAGAGFPGLALAVALPESEVRLVEAQARKCAFARDLCTRAEIANARVVCARAEEWVEGIDSHGAVLARALAPQAVVVEYAAPLLRVGGFLVDWRGRRDRAAERSGASAAERLGLELVEIRRMDPYAGARDHHLHLYAKVRATPEGFPRRAGMARKRPLA